MKVSELITKLQKENPDAEVFCYSELEEGGGKLRNVSEQTEFPYCKGDYPNTKNAAFVLLSSD